MTFNNNLLEVAQVLLAKSPNEDLLYGPEGPGQARSGKVSGSGGVLGFSESPHILCVAAVSPSSTHNFKKFRTSQIYLQRCEQNDFNQCDVVRSGLIKTYF